jgi:hypothetical protein
LRIYLSKKIQEICCRLVSEFFNEIRQQQTFRPAGNGDLRLKPLSEDRRQGNWFKPSSDMHARRRPNRGFSIRKSPRTSIRFSSSLGRRQPRGGLVVLPSTATKSFKTDEIAHQHSEAAIA